MKSLTSEQIRQIGNCHGSRFGSSPLAVLCRLSQELAYTRKRMCLRNKVEIQQILTQTDLLIEKAIRIAEEAAS